MAVRIRKNGRIFCAAMSKPMEGDCYINDNISYELSAERKVLITSVDHEERGGEWWWKGQEPVDVKIDPYYNNEN